ncbi:hypothetical protein [Sphingomonas agri]|uniref:hypothetical protein n=1 Tax=Sphingomonas agri TaxID=1813878 RepID=UPI00311F81C5
MLDDRNSADAGLDHHVGDLVARRFPESEAGRGIRQRIAEPAAPAASDLPLKSVAAREAGWRDCYLAVPYSAAGR